MGDNTKKLESRDELLDEIEKLESPAGRVGAKTLPSVKLSELDYAAPTDSELRSSAESELADYRRSGIAALREKSAASAEELAARREAVEAQRDADSRELEQKYADSARAIDNDVIRRGLARSSIASVERGALEREYLGQSADIAELYGKNLARIDADIASVDAKLQAALSDFNLSYATKLNQKLAELKAERDKQAVEIAKYNNEVRKSQAKLDSDRAKAESSLYSAALSQRARESSLDELSAARREEMYKAIYDKMDAYLGAMTKQQALLEIRNHTLYRQHLSNSYYNRLYDKYGRAYGDDTTD